MTTHMSRRVIGETTGRTITLDPAYGGSYTLPEVRFHDVLEDDGLVVWVGEEAYYAHWSEFDFGPDGKGSMLLYRLALAMDSGENVVRTRTAPEDLAGITTPRIPRTHVTLNLVFDQPAYYVARSRREESR